MSDRSHRQEREEVLASVRRLVAARSSAGLDDAPARPRPAQLITPDRSPPADATTGQSAPPAEARPAPPSAPAQPQADASSEPPAQPSPAAAAPPPPAEPLVLTPALRVIGPPPASAAPTAANAATPPAPRTPEAEAEPEADPAAEETPLPLAGLDEAALRALIAEVVRAELQGELGTRITRNLRKLVRAEIARALASRDFL